MTIEDYVATPADNYKFVAQQNAPSKPQPAAAPTVTPAAQPTSPQ